MSLGSKMWLLPSATSVLGIALIAISLGVALDELADELSRRFAHKARDAAPQAQ